MLNVFTVANFFIEKAPLSPLALNKLVYFAHGWWLAYKGEPLIDEGIQAWKYGPVVNSLYYETKQRTVIENVFVDGGKLSKSQVKFLEQVWTSYRIYTDKELSTLAHTQNTPWDIIYNLRGGKGKYGVVIPNSLIKEFFKQKNK